MTDDLPDVPALRVHEPPAGGLTALRERLGQRRTRWWLLALPAVAAAAIVLGIVARSPRPPAPPPPTAVLESGVYWVASTPGPRRRPLPPPPRVVSIDQLPTVTERRP